MTFRSKDPMVFHSILAFCSRLSHPPTLTLPHCSNNSLYIMVRFGRTFFNGRSPRTPDPDLSGWSGIEHEMSTHDDASMSDYDDDIDTMLVFAALFSAVVTTFAAQTYPSLQADSATTTNQLIAYQISLQGTQPDVPPVIGSTIANLLSPQTPQTSTSTRWINALFFLSLVLSLAAALLGIMAKQWIREYLKWNRSLAEPRVNVLVRQIRFDAWERWHVEGIFWSIPILLELAMMLFLAGVSVLLWTLDDVVARTITVVVATFLGLFAIITVLPVFNKRCPYKSPTSWVLVRLYGLTRDLSVSFLHRLFKWVYYMVSSSNPVDPWARVAYDWSDALKKDLASVQSWRDWDLDSCRVAGWDGRSWPWYSDAAKKYALAQLDEETHDLPLSSAATPSGQTTSSNSELPDYDLEYVIRDIRETSVLLRALSWVQQASQEQRVRQYIDESMQCIHTPVPSDQQVDTVRLRTVTDWCMLAAWVNGKLDDPHLLLTAPAHERSQTAARSIGQIRDIIGVQTERTSSGQQQLSPQGRRGAEFRRALLVPSQPDHRLSLSIVLQLLAMDLRYIMAADEDCTSGLDVQSSSSVRSQAISWGRLRRVAEIFRVMLVLWNFSEMRQTYLDVARAIVCISEPRQTQLSMSAPGILCRAFQLACELAEVTVCSDNGELEIKPGSMSSPKYDALVLDYFSAPVVWCDDRIKMFIFCVAKSSQGAAVPLSPDQRPRTVLNICDTVQLWLAGDDFEVLADLPQDWLPSVMSHANFDRDNASDAMNVFKDLLHALVRAYQRHRSKGLDCHSGWPKYLHDNLCASHEQPLMMPCNVAACPWISHSCDGCDACPLSKQEPPRPTTPYSHEHGDPNKQGAPISRLSSYDQAALNEHLHPSRLNTIPPTSNEDDAALELAEIGARTRIETDPRRIQPMSENSLLPPHPNLASVSPQTISEPLRTEAEDTSATSYRSEPVTPPSRGIPPSTRATSGVHGSSHL